MVAIVSTAGRSRLAAWDVNRDGEPDSVWNVLVGMDRFHSITLNASH